MPQVTQASQPDRGKPAWLAPVVVAAVILILVIAGSKKDEAVENPIVDLSIMTVAVFAFAAIFRFLFSKMGAPGAVAFFGGPVADSDNN
jgi:hypothetical protein